MPPVAPPRPVLCWLSPHVQEGEESTAGADSSTSSGTTGPQQQYKYVLEPGSEGKGKWVPVATGEDAAGQVKVMTQAEADSLNKQ